MKLRFILVIIASLVLGACSSKKDLKSLGANDPHLWLEEVEGEKALSWVKEQNDKTMGEITKTKRYKNMEKQALKILESKDKIPYVSMKGDYLYNFWKDAKNVRGLWRRTTLKSYKKRNPRWETVLDVDKLAKKEGENWVFDGANCLPPKYELCLVSLSRGGKDAAVVREFNTKTKTFVKGGFELKEAKSWVDWIDENSIFVGTDFGKGSLTSSGYPRIVKIWKRGTPLTQAKKVFEGESKDMVAFGSTLFSADGNLKTVGRRYDFYSGETHVLVNGELKKIPVQDSANFRGYFKGYFILSLREDWTLGDKTYKKGSLLALNSSAAKEGKANAGNVQLLFEQTANSSIRGATVTKDRILVNSLENVRGQIYEIRLSGTTFTKPKNLNLIKNAHLTLAASDDSRNDFFFNFSGFTSPDALYYVGEKSNKAVKVKSLPAKFNAKGMTVKQLWVTSKDGTKVPYFLVGKESVIKKGKAPTLLYGYGGFEVSLTPRYKPVVGKLWLENGGLYVMANIRGGGEFGPNWHQAALKTKRHKAYDDFIAVAEDLVKKGTTTKEHLAIQGGSNGGLLVGAVMTRRPDLFKSVLCHVPLLDMIRYSQLLAGASWMAEYGDPTDPEMYDYLKSYSPYHNLSKEKKYPELFVLTSTKDDRVHPGHARKMVKKMTTMGIPNIRYYENIEGGHGGAANLKQVARMRALTYEFLYKTIK